MTPTPLGLASCGEQFFGLGEEGAGVPNGGMKMRMLGLMLLVLLGMMGRSEAAEDMLGNLKAQHPRLLVTDSTWKELAKRRKQSPVLDQLLQKMERDGRSLLAAPPLTYHKTGKRLLSVSREAIKRILLWSFNYRMTGDEVFRARAEQEMLAAAAFPDWNPSHFLDVGEMTTAMALGYDWLYDVLPAASRKTIREAIVEKGLKPGLDPKIPQNYWYRVEMNWNQVCIGGLTLGALAIADEESEIARTILSQAKEYNPNGMKPYVHGGNYPEGPSYWGYGTMYQVLLLAGLESALGTDWGLGKSPGFYETAIYPMETTGPTGLSFNYSDGEANNGIEPALYWFAQKLSKQDILRFQHDELAHYVADKRPPKPDTSADRFMPLLAIWGGNLDTVPQVKEPLAWHEDGPNPLAIFRSSWTDPKGLYLALKGGAAEVNHGHMDAGSFIFEADGVRWAEDLGKQDYESLESKKVDLWNRAQNSQRWEVFRLNNLSHNTLTINGQHHQVKGHAPIIRFVGGGNTPHAVVDLSAVFAGQATKVVRGFKMFEGDHRVLIQDELSGLKPGDTVRWAFVTGAKVFPQGNEAILNEKGQTLSLSLRQPAEGQFEVIPADPPKDDFNAANPGESILIANLKVPASGELLIQVLLEPGAPKETLKLGQEPCESWSAALPVR